MKVFRSMACLFFVFSSAASAQDPHRSRGQGYFFVAPGVIGHNEDQPAIHIGAGGEGFIYRGLAIGIELGPVGPLKTGPYNDWLDNVIGLGSANLSYHFLPNNLDRRFESFVTAGYSLFFRAGTFNGYNIGGGTNVWLSKNAALRLEARGHSTAYYHFVGFRIGITFR